MPAKSDFILQLKITLKGIRPPVWRRILVPSTFTFLDLHFAIQDAMPWENCHLFEFEARPKGERRGNGLRIGGADPWYGDEGLPVDETNVAGIFAIPGMKVSYTYDFGDSWEHDVKLEKLLPAEKGVEYPLCVAGKRACPPEDCGGVWGYANMVQKLMDPKHPEHEEAKEWVGGELDPEAFDPKEVVFRGQEGRFAPGVDEIAPRDETAGDFDEDEDDGEGGEPSFRIVKD